MTDTTRAAPGDGLHDSARAETADGRSGAEQARDPAQQKAEDLRDQAQDKAEELRGQAGDRVRSVVGERSTQAGEQINRQADDLRTVAQQLREQGKDGPAKVADQASQRVERLGGYLTRSDPDTILGDLEDAARRNPWAVVAGGLALGFAASRFLKASSAERRRGRELGQTPPQLPRRTGTPTPTPAPATGPTVVATPPPTAHPAPGGPSRVGAF